MIRFLINQQIVELDTTRADLTLLQFLREHKKLTGTKEGCAAGDCGACTLVLAEPDSQFNSLRYYTVNSCITLMSAVHGKQLITVEHLANDNQLHPVQQALIDFHGSQCGFCTPGFIMSMFALYHAPGVPDRNDVIHALSGNLCRCTGYRPIIDATLSACANAPDDKFSQRQSATLQTLKNLVSDPQCGTQHLIMPNTRESLATAIAKHPDAQIVAGSTDVSLQFTQQLKRADTLISLANMTSLKGCTKTEHSIIIGAATPLSEATYPMLQHFPQLAELITRFASLPIRNQATLGGNIANASPIGDMPPVLLALNATLHIDNGKTQRQLAICDFFTGYRKTSLQPGEWLSAIEIPFLPEQSIVAAYKVSKRMEDDISAVCAAFNVTLENDKIVHINSGFGGVAATPISANRLNDALIGKRWSDKECVEIGQHILTTEFRPIDDVRATGTYRKTVLANLWHRFWIENQANSNIETRVVHHA